MKMKKPLIIGLVTVAVVTVIVVAVVLSVHEVHSNVYPINRPHIVVIIGDDTGWNDFGFHGSSQIPTPNIDALGYNGVILDRFYTAQACTPSRSALLTGNYPIRSGMQGWPLRAGEDRAIPLDMPTMPELLKGLDYKTHLVGKWHLGAATRRNTPTGRGFDTHFGYWNGFVGYFDYTISQTMADNTTASGFDLHNGVLPAWSEKGKYAPELFTDKAVEIIEKHDDQSPLFLVLAHLAAHTGKDGLELEVPDVNQTDERFGYIQDPSRRRYAEIVSALDRSVGRVVTKLHDRSMLDNSIVLFFSDNGGQTQGLYANTGSNWPLRGLKHTMFEGGVRTVAAIYSPFLEQKGYVNRQLISVTDWLPTFYRAAGGDLDDLGNIDGIDQWDVLSENQSTTRQEVLVNIDGVDRISALITDKGRYKLVNGTYRDGSYEFHYGETGRGPEVPAYNLSDVLESPVNRAILDIKGTVPLTEGTLGSLRSLSDLSWCRNQSSNFSCVDFCLFDLEQDPCETRNLLQDLPEVGNRLRTRLGEFWEAMVPQTNKAPDPASNPVLYNGTWCTWLDDEVCFKTPVAKK